MFVLGFVVFIIYFPLAPEFNHCLAAVSVLSILLSCSSPSKSLLLLLLLGDQFTVPMFSTPVCLILPQVKEFLDSLQVVLFGCLFVFLCKWFDGSVIAATTLLLFETLQQHLLQL